MNAVPVPERNIDVVFGGRGFLAAAIQKRLVAANRPFRVVTRDKKTFETSLLGAGGELVQGDVNATKALPAILEGARNAYFAVPITSLAQVPGDWNPLPFLAACAEAGVHLVVPVDMSLYATDANPPFDEKAVFAGRSPIGDAQLEWENAVLVEGLRRRFAVTVLRLPPLLGEGLRNSEMLDAIARVRGARAIEIAGRGEEVIERLHVDDAARACVLAAGRRQVSGEIIHIPGHPIRRRNFYRVLVKVAASKSEVVSVEIPEGSRRRRRDAGEATRDFWVRGERARRLLGFAPEVPYERALRESLRAPSARDAASA